MRYFGRLLALAVAFGLLALSAAPQRQQGQVPMIADSPAIVIPPTTPDQVTSAPRAEVAPNPATPALAALDRVSRHDWLAPNFGSLLPNVLADSSNVSLDAAARTDARAQFLVGGGHLYGIGGYRDDNAEAARFFRLSANQGFAPAQYYLGFISDTAGEHEDSARWYRLAANQGFLDAQFRLGAMYADGIGVPQDEAEAVRLFRRAADRGSADAQYNMGVMYDNGRGVMRDRVEAVRYWRLAARQGYPGAQTILRRLGETW